MNVLEKIKLNLNSSRTEYGLYEHSYVKTSEEASKVRGTPLGWGVKALIFIADAKPVLICVPGDRKVDSSKFKKAYSVRDLRMATSEEVNKLTGLEFGSIPPLGSVFGIPCYYDNCILQNEFSVFNAGDHCVSVKIKSQDLVNFEKPLIGSFIKD